MGEDIRLPIVALFTILGAILSIYGIFTNGTEMYAKLTSNVNIWTGVGMLIFGIYFLVMALKKDKKNPEDV